MIIGAAITAELLINRQRLAFRILAIIIVGLLGTAAARSTRAALLLGQSFQPSQTAFCVSGSAPVDELKRISGIQKPSVVLTNIQGLAWYAMRIPTLALTKSAFADAPSGTIIIFSRPEYTCSQVLLDSLDIGEVALTRARDVN